MAADGVRVAAVVVPVPLIAARLAVGVAAAVVRVGAAAPGVAVLVVPVASLGTTTSVTLGVYGVTGGGK